MRKLYKLDGAVMKNVFTPGILFIIAEFSRWIRTKSTLVMNGTYKEPDSKKILVLRTVTAIYNIFEKLQRIFLYHVSVF